MDLRPYQHDAVEWMHSHHRCIYGDAAGSGKTPTTLAALNQRGVVRTLVVCPKTVLPHWEEEAALWYPSALPWRYLGPKRHVPDFPTPTIVLTTYETFRADVETLGRVQWGAVVFDEGHRLKNRNALVTKKANRFLTLCHPHSLWFLTGTPVVNRADEAWSLLHMIDRVRFPSYWRWTGQHCEIEENRWIRRGQTIKIVKGLLPGHEELVRKELAEFVLQRPLDVLLPDLPEVTTTTVHVKLSAPERKAYDELARRKWTKVNGEILQTINEVSRLTRYRQIAEGMEFVGDSKISAAVELARDLDPEQVVILTWSKRAAEEIALKLNAGMPVDGDMKPAERQNVFNLFAAGKKRVLVGTYGVLGEGVDGLQVARHLIQVSQEWTPAKNDQAIARLQRSGQKSAVNVYKIVARDTIDEYIEAVLAQKRSVIEALRTDPEQEVLDGHCPTSPRPVDEEVGVDSR